MNAAQKIILTVHLAPAGPKQTWLPLLALGKCAASLRCLVWVHVRKCTAGVPPARGKLAEREDEGGRDARGTLWAVQLRTCTRLKMRIHPPLV